MKKLCFASVLCLSALALGGCGEHSTKLYTCEGERLAYRNNIDFRIFKFDDFSIVLQKKMSLSALILGETRYQIDGDVLCSDAPLLILHEILFQRACWNGGHRIVRGVRAIVLRCERRAASSSEDG